MKTIVILGSTGSIGKSLLKIINKDKSSFRIKLLTANKNYKQLLYQAKLFNVKNVILTDKKIYESKKKVFKKNKINVFNNFSILKKVLIRKVDYAMSSIVGLDGLEPTFKIIKHTRIIAIANKESIICGWNIIKKEINKYNTKFIPVDSEHFSIWYSLNKNNNLIKKIFLTASGGPFLTYSKNKLKKIRIKDALKHPNWKMGPKISIDSATLINKVFELIEAKKIFEIYFEQISIIIHPKSYVHSIIEFKNGLIKLIAHNTNMMIPIFNSIFESKKKLNFYNKGIEFSKLNNLQLQNVNTSKFPLIKILNLLPKNDSLFETALVAANDELVSQFLNKKINFHDISKKLLKFLNKKEIVQLKHISPSSINEIAKINNYVRLKIQTKDI